MKRAGFDDDARELLTGCVKEIEAITDAEMVLVVRSRSGSYRQADYLFGSILAFLTLLFLLFSPFDFHQYWVAIDVALAFLLGALLSARSNSIPRLLTSKRARNEAVRLSAAATFYEAGIANTKHELGVLIYLSVLERRLELVADRGVLKSVPALEWNRILFDLGEAGTRAEPNVLLWELRNFGALLARYLPASSENPNELPDAARFDVK
ncbi:MAG: hypothetical protein ABR501_03260 [Pyrinomonadaceae bacterium]